MAIQFCVTCGDTLPLSAAASVACECCGTANINALLGSVAVSASSAFPSELRRRRTIHAPQTPAAATDAWSVTDATCPQCRATEVRYTALQLRSADESSTLFYYCPACDARWNENN